MCFRQVFEKGVLPKVGDEIKKTQQPSKNTAKDFVSGGGTGTPTSTGSANSQVKVGASTSNSSRTANRGLTRLRIPRSTT
jgi:hypothetical protein